MTLRLYLPGDTTALALGADEVAVAIQAQAKHRSLAIDLVRNGSRGMFWLEPLLEFEQNGKRLAFGPVSVSDVPHLLDALVGNAAQHALCLGVTDEIDWLAAQQRLTFGRVGLGDPLSLDNYLALEGFTGLHRALSLSPDAIVQEITESGLRGRGGAAFPAGRKWRTVLDTPAVKKTIVCNADEGDSGTFADRLLMEADPFQLIEGMVIAGLAVGATSGIIYLRSEYPAALASLNAAIATACEHGYVGDDICGSGKSFQLQVRLGAGAYICGEETALLESLEGRRGMVRVKPPLPAVEGLFGQPTVVNNVLTLAAVTTIMAQGAAFYRNLGAGRSRGTLVLQLAGNVRCGGLLEIPFGVTLRQVVEQFAGGTYSGRPIKALQVGGPLGAYLPASLWDTPLDYEAFTAAGAMLGHGGVVVFDDTVDMREQARFAMEFCAVESCGKCTPCRIGSVRGVEVIDRLAAGQDTKQHRELLLDLCDTMEHGSLCAMGGLTPTPVRSALANFPEDFT